MMHGFEVWPAIDLKGGEVVRLAEGDMGRATVYDADPGARARAFAAAGAPRLHVVDLDGAFAGGSVNGEAVRAILAAGLRVQLGGGIRSRGAIERWLALGVERVVLGTAALRDPALVREAARAHPGRIVAAVDARDGRVMVEGWAVASELEAGELARRMADAGAAALLFTDIGRDGLLSGPNVEATEALARACGMPVLASGGVSGLADLRRLADTAAAMAGPGRIAGAVVGRALYDGRLALADALALG